MFINLDGFSVVFEISIRTRSEVPYYMHTGNKAGSWSKLII